MLARVGLSKFAMLLRDSPLQQAEQFAERIRSGINTLEIVQNKKKHYLTVSLGLFEPRLDRDDDIKAQMTITETYLQQAIDSGGNQLVSFSELSFSDAKAVNLETALSYIQHDQTEKLHGLTESLIARVMPLMEYLTRQFGDDATGLLEALKQKLRR